jgi:tetratricopeptide (TPR) repeat protein
MKKFLLISVIIGWTASTSTLSAQNNTVGNGIHNTADAAGLDSFAERATVDVVLKAPNGVPVKGAVVTLITFAGHPYQQLSPDTNLAHFGDVASAEYNVRVIAPGFVPATLQVDAKPRHPAQLIFELQPLSAEDAAFASRVAALPPKAQQQLGKAMDALRVDNTAKAQHPLENLQRLAPNHPEVNYLLGVYASKTKDEAHAKSYWTRTIELDPRHLQALLALSDIALRENDYDEAFVLSQRATQADPSSWRAQAVLASAYSRKNNNPEALQHAERAVELGHAQADTVAPMLAFLLASSGNKDGAIEVLQSYLKDHPTNTDAKAQLDRIEKGEFIVVSASNTAEDAAVASATTAIIPASNWLPPDVDEKMPPVDSATGCDVAAVVTATGKRVEELMHNVDRYTATESLFHESINKWGAPDSKASRKFNYVASITEMRPGIFDLEEYRGSGGSPAEFPDGIATLGLPGLALIFHPHNAGNYDMICEGVTKWEGVPVWQIHFRQRPDKPNNMRSYQMSLNGPSKNVSLKGRAWIAVDSSQLVRLETDLVAPLPEIKLVADHIMIDYGPVHFKETGTDLWLPRSAEVFFFWNNARMHRVHSFSDYLLFSVDNQQKISAPKGADTAPDDRNSTQPPNPDAKSPDAPLNAPKVPDAVPADAKPAQPPAATPADPKSSLPPAAGTPPNHR